MIRYGLASFVVCILLTVSSGYVQAQDAPAPPSLEGKWQVEGSTGYFSPGRDGSEPGFLVSIAVGRHLSTGFLVSGEIGMAHSYFRYRDDNPLFPGNRLYATHYIYRLRFQYPIQLGTRHRLGLNTGVMYRRFYENYEGEAFQSDFAGLIAGLQYAYDARPLLLGIRLDTHLRYDDGIGDYMAVPFIAIEM
jgi:hypothetical protein